MLNRVPARNPGDRQPSSLSEHRRWRASQRTIGLFCPLCKHVFETTEDEVRKREVTCSECETVRLLTNFEAALLGVPMIVDSGQ